MKIKQIVSQHRRDFRATYECEHCHDVTAEKSGYDDDYFHNHVIPDMICIQCGKKSEGASTPATPKYDASKTV